MSVPVPFEVEQVDELEFALSGDLSLDTAPTLREALEPVLAPGIELTLDLGAIRMLDSSGIRELILANRAVQPDGTVVLLGAPPRVARVLRLAGLDRAEGFRMVDRIVDLRETLGQMPAAARESLLRVITAHPSFRARVIERLNDLPEKQDWADILVILDDDDEARNVVISLLQAVDQPS